MIPVSFEQENLLLDPPPGVEGEPLSVCQTTIKDGLPVLISCWKLTKEDLELIQKTGRVWLYVYSTHQPLVFVDAANPFQENKDERPDS